MIQIRHGRVPDQIVPGANGCSAHAHAQPRGTHHGQHPERAHRDVRSEPRPAADSGRQQRLTTTTCFLRTDALHGKHPVDRDDRRHEDAHVGEVARDDVLRTAHRIHDDVGHVYAGISERPHRHPRNEHAHRPPRDSLPFKTPGETERRAQPSHCPRLPTSNREHARSDVSTSRERVSCDRRCDRERERDRERPPAIQYKGSSLLCPGERRKPGDEAPMRVRHVSERSEHESHPEAPSGSETRCGAGVLGQLNDDRGESREGHPRGEASCGEEQRAFSREYRVGDHDQRRQYSQHAVRHDGDQQCSGEGCMATYRIGAHELGATGLFLDPSVADDEQDAHKGDEEQLIESVTCGNEGRMTHVVQKVGRPEPHSTRRHARHRHDALQVLRGRVGALGGLGVVRPEDGATQDPGWQLDAVAAQHQPHKLPRACQGVYATVRCCGTHRATPTLSSASGTI